MKYIYNKELNKKRIETQRRNSRFRLELQQKATKEELIFKKFLDENHIKYIFQKGFIKPFHRIVDFYISKYRLIIEIDGGYHIDCKDKDDLKDKLWNKFNTLRILNTEVNNGTYIAKFNMFIKGLAHY